MRSILPAAQDAAAKAAGSPGYAIIPIITAGGRKGFPCSIWFHSTPSEDRSPEASPDGEKASCERNAGLGSSEDAQKPTQVFLVGRGGDILGHYHQHLVRIIFFFFFPQYPFRKSITFTQ